MRSVFSLFLCLLAPPTLAQDNIPTVPPTAQRFLHWLDQSNGIYTNHVREGHLRLIASKWTKADRGKLKGPFWGAPNTLSQRQLGIGKTRIEAKLDITGLKPGTRAAITPFSGFFPGRKSGSYALFGVREDNDGKRVLFFVVQDSATVGEALSREVETIYLRSDTDFDRATFSWSLDGETWKLPAHTYQLDFGSWRGNRPGLFCWNAHTDEPNEAGWVDVDWFRYEPNEL